MLLGAELEVRCKGGKGLGEVGTLEVGLLLLMLEVLSLLL